MNRSRLLRSFLVLGLVTGALYACSSSDDASATGADTTGAQVHGKVTAAGGAPLAGVTVSAGGATATTDAKGVYTLKAAAGESVVRFALTGYADGHERLVVNAKYSTQLDATLLPVATTATIDAAAGGEVPTTRGGKVIIPANALVDAAGAAVTGQVTVSLTPIDPSNADELRAAPGDFQATQGGQPTMLESYGMLDITIRRGTDKLQVASGKTLELHIPAPATTATPDATMPLWSFDETTGLWKDEGTATYDPATRSYVAQAPHMSVWNCDKPYLATCACGSVYTKDGAKLAGARVVAGGITYLGTSEATTNDDGRFCIAVRKDSDVAVAAYHKSGGGQTRNIRSGNADTNVPPTMGDARCVDIGRWDVEKDVFVSSNGTSSSCAAVNDTFANSCAADLGKAIGTCFQPSGACTVRSSGTSFSITYANGAKVSSSESGTFVYTGASGATCLTGTVDTASADGASVKYTLPNGKTYTFETTSGGAYSIHCPNGETATVTAEQQQAIEACSPQSGSTSSSSGQSCTIEGYDAGTSSGGGGNTGATCTTDANCTGGNVCCTLQTSSKVCFPQATCDAVKSGGH